MWPGVGKFREVLTGIFTGGVISSKEEPEDGHGSEKELSAWPLYLPVSVWWGAFWAVGREPITQGPPLSFCISNKGLQTQTMQVLGVGFSNFPCASSVFYPGTYSAKQILPK